MSEEGLVVDSYSGVKRSLNTWECLLMFDVQCMYDLRRR